MIEVVHVLEISSTDGTGIVMRTQSNGTVDVTIELSETECYGIEIPLALFVHSMDEFLTQARQRLTGEQQ